MIWMKQVSTGTHVWWDDDNDKHKGDDEMLSANSTFLTECSQKETKLSDQVGTTLMPKLLGHAANIDKSRM